MKRWKTVMYFSKSKYTSFRQCPKIVWIDKYKPEEKEIDESAQERMASGNIVGDLARTLFGDFTEVTTFDDDGKLDLDAMKRKTAECIDKGIENICETSFDYNGLYCAVDILRKENGGYAMYVLKKLRGVNAVQTLSRLNRICPPLEKKTFILDFVNTYDDIVKAFAPYYTTTLLANSVTPTAVYDLEAKLDGYMILDPYDVNMAAEIIYKKIIESKDKNQLRFYLQRAEKKLKEYDLMKQIEIMAVVRHFIRFYEFLIQVSCFEDVELHKKYLFLTYFVSFVNISQPGDGFDLSGKIKADNFIQKKGEEHKTTKVTPDPIVKLPTADDFNLNEDKVKRLSEIIDEINSKTGKTYDNDVVIKAMLQIKDLMMKSEKLRESAKANTESDFAFSYFDGIDDALIEGLSQNQDFFSLLLSNDEMKKEVLGIFVSEIYKSLREDK